MQRRSVLMTFASAIASGCVTVPRVVHDEPEVLGIIEYGQSNSEGQALRDAAVLREHYPSQLRMPQTAANNVWLGQATTGGRSLELAAQAVTGLAPLRGTMGSATHGSTAGQSMALRLVAPPDATIASEIVLFNVAEGGQSIRNLGQDAPPNYFGFRNLVRVSRAVADALRREGKRYVVRVVITAQGESDTKSATLGARQDAVRAQIETAVRAITGQGEPVWMLSVQPSSFQDSANGVLSILARHEDSLAGQGNFVCVGPTYPFPFSGDYLHHTSEGHDMRGELYALAYTSLIRTGRFDVLRAVGASVVAPHRIAIELSEDAAIEHVPKLPQLDDLGMTLVGARIAAIAVSGRWVTLSTVEPAADVTAIRIGLSPQAARRSAHTIPRTSIRSALAYGNYRNGMVMRKWLCHQELLL